MQFCVIFSNCQILVTGVSLFVPLPNVATWNKTLLCSSLLWVCLPAWRVHMSGWAKLVRAAKAQWVLILSIGTSKADREKIALLFQGGGYQSKLVTSREKPSGGTEIWQNAHLRECQSHSLSLSHASSLRCFRSSSKPSVPCPFSVPGTTGSSSWSTASVLFCFFQRSWAFKNSLLHWPLLTAIPQLLQLSQDIERWFRSSLVMSRYVSIINIFGFFLQHNGFSNYSRISCTLITLFSCSSQVHPPPCTFLQTNK